MAEKNVLRMENVTMQFGGVVAVNDLSLDVPEGKIVALIGPNGAGKSTAFNCITGVYEPTNGRVEFYGENYSRNHPTGKMKKNYLKVIALFLTLLFGTNVMAESAGLKTKAVYSYGTMLDG